MKFNVLLFDFMHLLLCHCAATQISYFTFSRLRSLVAIVTQSDARAFCASARERETERSERAAEAEGMEGVATFIHQPQLFWHIDNESLARLRLT